MMAKGDGRASVSISEARSTPALSANPRTALLASLGRDMCLLQSLVGQRTAVREVVDVESELVNQKLQPQSEDSNGSPGPTEVQEQAAAGSYAEICANIRATDDISFKLLGLVPLVSGAAIVTYLSADRALAWSPMTFFLAVFGAIVTF